LKLEAVQFIRILDVIHNVFRIFLVLKHVKCFLNIHNVAPKHGA